VSLESALSWYGLIPEFVPSVTSVTTVRPQVIQTLLGRFEFRHIDKDFFWGYSEVKLLEKQNAFIALPEKALLDLVYLTADGDKKEFLEELRLQNFEKIDKDVLRQFTEKSDSPKLKRAVVNIESIIAKGEGIEL
jgi:hypothetical protein